MSNVFKRKQNNFKSIHDSFTNAVHSSYTTDVVGNVRSTESSASSKQSLNNRAYSGTQSDNKLAQHTFTSDSRSYDAGQAAKDPFSDRSYSSGNSNYSGRESDIETEPYSSSPGAHVNGKRIVFSNGFVRYIKETENGPTVDKMAEGSSFSSAGDGAFFNNRFKDSGKLVSSVYLVKGSERVSSQGKLGRFKNTARNFGKSAEFIKDTSDLVRSSEEETPDNKLDGKLEKGFSHVYRDSRRERDRYRSVRKKTHRDVKELEKEIHDEKKADAQKLRDLCFKSSAYSFSSNNDFSGSDYHGRFSHGPADHGVNFIPSYSDPGQFAPAYTATALLNNRTNVLFKEDVRSLNYVQPSFSVLSSKDLQNRTMTKQELLDQKKSELKAVKKAEKKQIRKMAAVTSVQNMLETKKNLTNEIMGNGQITGDLLVDGTSGLTKSFSRMFIQGIKRLAGAVFRTVGSIILKVISFLCSLVPMFLPILLIAMPIIMFFSGIQAIRGLLAFDDVYELDVESSGTFVGDPLSSEEIDNIIDSLKSQDGLSSEQEAALRFALEAVGCAYDMNAHSNLNDRVFDCSELAFRSMSKGGVDISEQGVYFAAAECYACQSRGYKVSTGMGLRPGDLIFYSGGTTGKDFVDVKNVGHVSIYLGKINGVDRMVEAAGDDYGVIVSDVRTSNIYSICRPFS